MDKPSADQGIVRVRRVLSKPYRAVLVVGGLVGFILTWTGWTGPELLNRITQVPWLDFVGSGWFRTVLLAVGLVVVIVVVRAWFKASPTEIESVQVEAPIGSLADFTLQPSLGRLPADQGVRMVGDGRMFKQLTALWVTVENHAEDAVFTAQVRGIHPVVRAEDDLDAGPRDVDEVAWEHTTRPENLIRWRKRARLKLAQGSESWQLFWFWTAESTTWTDQGDQGWQHYGIGWRLKPKNQRVEFDLEVIDTTHQHAESRRCFIEFGSTNRIEDFGFVDSGGDLGEGHGKVSEPPEEAPKSHVEQLAEAHPTTPPDVTAGLGAIRADDANRDECVKLIDDALWTVRNARMRVAASGIADQRHKIQDDTWKSLRGIAQKLHDLGRPGVAHTIALEFYIDSRIVEGDEADVYAEWFDRQERALETARADVLQGRR